MKIPSLPTFPPGFLWGASASAFQTEGAARADGKGPSGWDAFAAQPGRIKDGGDGTRGTGFYERYREDVALLAGLGAGAFRFSVSWPRVVPDGTGAVNAAGLDFYDRLVDDLCAHGITPAPTLYHWDTPLALEERGGWLDRDTAYRFADYAGIVAERLGDRVPMWITINEPAEVTLLGYALGEHAPGKKMLFDALPAAHHQLLAHGLAVRALRAAGASDIGIAVSHTPVWTAGDSEEDRFGAELYDTVSNWLFADPLLTGAYPDENFAALMPGPVAEDLEIISTPLDWYGVNYYNPTLVGAPAPQALDSFAGFDIPSELPFGIREIEGYDRTDFGWPVVPDGLREMLIQLESRYGDRLPPLYITENGCSYDGIEDPRRIAFLDGHLRSLHTAMSEGVDVRGYFTWSLTDNFEWIEGNAQRFGLVHVDYETMRRTPKDSYHWYREVIRGSKS
ncbi:GH1 family beta-glucosidase [Streptomyces sp. NBC_01387]|uniref:GH1 family beta-glucosidase n=1 Tax=unclassified Streptomyces TaxID=2593676 RepID=UPI00202496DE|nr:MULTISPECIES: GH1 family beta-glucosidase [unclassified Streptomyces]WSC19133.1 GH1 family beta-glucosidase [Streptomyces sp. NBC_01766]WSV53158.1 GH1 family beta-glucosidase [Streptomyces sp. NBC_01014]